MSNSNFLVGDTAVLISSCDAYSDVWEPFFTLFSRYWPDCPFTIYLLTNSLKHDVRDVSVLALGNDRCWARMISKSLEHIQKKYIVYLQEDYLLDRQVDTSRLINLLEYMHAKNAGYLRLYPSPGPDRSCDDNLDVGEILPGSAYRTGLQAAIWCTETLHELLMDGESPWDMEINGSKRSIKHKRSFLSVQRDPYSHKILNPPISYFCTGIVRGQWAWDVKTLVRKEGLRIDTNKRSFESFHSYIRRRLIMQLPLFYLLYERGIHSLRKTKAKFDKIRSVP